MQYPNRIYNPEKHDKFHALTVKQPYADLLVSGEKTIEVRSRRTKYRGDLLICSSASPVMPGHMSGCTLGLVELYEIKPVADFTEDDWAMTRIPAEKRATIKKGYGWLMRNPRRVIEYPIKGQLGIYNLVYTKGEITEYPCHVRMDRKAFKKLTRK